MLGLALAACGRADPMVEVSQPTSPTAEPAELATTELPTESEASATPETTETDLEPTSPAATFTIQPSESEARFIINEVLLGRDKTVVGTTNDVSGTITPDFEAPDQTAVGTFTVDLSTLVTDDNNRTRTLHGRILETGVEAFRFATFETNELSGLPESITIGEPFSFQLSGDLTIHGVTLEKTFDVSATAVSESRIEGLASLPITYPEFGVQILRLPQQVASVEEQVILELEFVAEPE